MGCHLCKALPGLGSARQEVADVRIGTNETRIRDESGICRVTNVAKFEEAIHVPYRFQKKTLVSCKENQATEILTASRLRLSEAATKKTAKSTIATGVEMLQRLDKPVELAIGRLVTRLMVRLQAAPFAKSSSAGVHAQLDLAPTRPPTPILSGTDR